MLRNTFTTTAPSLARSAVGTIKASTFIGTFAFNVLVTFTIAAVFDSRIAIVLLATLFFTTVKEATPGFIAFITPAISEFKIRLSATVVPYWTALVQDPETTLFHASLWIVLPASVWYISRVTPYMGFVLYATFLGLTVYDDWGTTVAGLAALFVAVDLVPSLFTGMFSAGLQRADPVDGPFSVLVVIGIVWYFGLAANNASKPSCIIVL
jgi:hypothetical protein